MYKIKHYSYNQAKKLGVQIASSNIGHKKIDVFRKGIKIASIGDRNFLDYPTYLQMEKRGIVPPGYADQRRKLYHKRHKKEIRRKNSPGYYALKILW